GLLTVGRGQRVGIFSGAGVGKSTLLASMARTTSSDVSVIALIGERGREATEFVERMLGTEGLAKSVVIVSTGDEPPLRRVRATQLAMTIAEGFRSEGSDVLFCMDSLTRYARALRQLALACGEPPATRGFPASVFARLPVLIERAGALRGGGSITGLFTVLVEGDDLTDPVSDAAMGMLDGHIVLSRDIASRGRFPAVDPLASVSRLADAVSDDNHIAARREVRKLLAAWSEVEDLVSIGAYAAGSNPLSDVAIELRPAIESWLEQSWDEPVDYPETCRQLVELATSSLRMQQPNGRVKQVGAL
ncbi:MAG: FliI/YscN family ATPase, partial [Phycisphaerales bacterium]|nr:FliI/YscN family ATPase [Phycisphaerales bacterium]